MIAAASMNDLKRQRPEWEPWLAVVAEVLGEATGSRWDAMVPPRANSDDPRAPLLVGASVTLDARPVRQLFERLVRVARRGRTAKMLNLNASSVSDIELARLFQASVWHDHDVVTGAAATAGMDPEALQAVVALLAVPFLQACHRRWASSIREDWMHGYCPLCASWPAFAEVRGIERSRFFRCGRCGGEWHSPGLSCPYCATNDHRELVSLVPANGASHGVIEACRPCRGYVKTFTTLEGCLPAAVMVEDLASVDLDLAALAHGYARPNGAGYHSQALYS
jgi:FdhE protein